MAVATRHIHHQRLLLATTGNNNNNSNNALDDDDDDDLTEDEVSKLSRFLFRSKNNSERIDGDGDDDTKNQCCFLKCCSRRNTTTTTTDADEDVIYDDENDIMEDDETTRNTKRLNRMDVSWYALDLEPMEIRSERVIMLFEAYTIFGALFLSGTWVLYEWGSPKAYGGNESDDIVGRIFEFIMAMAFVCNFWLVVAGATGWLPAIASSSNDPNFLWGAKRMLSFCHILIMSTISCIAAGVLLGVYLNLHQNGLEVFVALVIGNIIFFAQTRIAEGFMVTVTPLELYHHPFLSRVILAPYHALTYKGRKELRSRAIERAMKLKLRRKSSFTNNLTTSRTKATNFSSFISTTTTSSNSNNNSTQQQQPNNTTTSTSSSRSSIGLLLREAAKNCGRAGCDVSVYEAKLDEDWYNDVAQLKTMSVDILSRYMPRRLAEEVQKELAVVTS